MVTYMRVDLRLIKSGLDEKSLAYNRISSALSVMENSNNQYQSIDGILTALYNFINDFNDQEAEAVLEYLTLVRYLLEEFYGEN